MDYKCLDGYRIYGKGDSYEDICFSNTSEKAPVKMINLGGMTICGKRGGNSFTNA